MRGWKKITQNRLENCITECGFKYYKPMDKFGSLVYIKFQGEEPNPSWIKELVRKPAPPHEMITIYKSQWESAITVQLSSNLRSGAGDLGIIATGGDVQTWWRFDSKEELNAALDEIEDLLNKYAWDWFTLE